MQQWKSKSARSAPFLRSVCTMLGVGRYNGSDKERKMYCKKCSIIFVLCLALSGCGPKCEFLLFHDVFIEVYDKETKEKICGVSGYIMGADFLEEFETVDRKVCEDSGVAVGRDLDGLYQISVFKEGYKDWESGEIALPNENILCHPGVEVIEVYLERSGT